MEDRSRRALFRLWGALFALGISTDETITCDLPRHSGLCATAESLAASVRLLTPTTVRIILGGEAFVEAVKVLGRDLSCAGLQEHERRVSGSEDSELGRAFVAGIVEVAGSWGIEAGEPFVSLVCGRPRIVAYIQAKTSVPASVLPLEQEGAVRLTWLGVSAIDVVGHLWESDPGSMPDALRAWYHRSTRATALGEAESNGARESVILVQKLCPAAVLPAKVRVSDSGYDLTLVGVERVVGQVVLYRTGLRIKPPWGYYFDVVPRSSIIKRGYVLANNVGVIDQAYRGELLIPLLKVDQSMPDLQLPARVVQMIPRRVEHFSVAQAETLDDSARGERGFGSSGHD